MFNTGRYSCFLLIAFALTLLFWWPLFFGHGLIGGDLYPYFFPQKVFYADCLRAGELPLWNDLTGFGYPILGESQTGAAYPFHVLFYWWLPVNTAYNVEHLLHYGICFLATVLFASRLGLCDSGAVLAGLVFTYGWFPPRACLEWAILTGCWLPVALFCVESFLQSRQWRYSIALSAALGLQLLAGHFHLAFITHITVASYAVCRLWIDYSAHGNPDGALNRPAIGRAAAALILAAIAGFCLAGVQLIPAWELKQRSTRVVADSDYDPAYGHLPPLYASQLIAPWLWYSPQEIAEDNFVRAAAELVAPWQLAGPDRNLDQAIRQARFAALETGTNKVEAHLYCGLIPILLAFGGISRWVRSQRAGKARPRITSVMDATTGYWLLVAALALVYATGWLLPIGRELPGFSFFRGPGRYGIVTTLAVGLLAGQMLGELMRRNWSVMAKSTLLAAILASATGDLWLVSRMVTYTTIVSAPAINFRDASPVRKLLASEDELPRLLCPGPNVGTLLGVSCVPWYLGIAPAEYVDGRYAMPEIPKPLLSGHPTPASKPLLDWLSQAGVTHVLHFEPLDERGWGVDLVWKGVDPCLNRIWGRPEPIHLYRFVRNHQAPGSPSFPGRARLQGDSVDSPAIAKAFQATSQGRGSRRVVVASASAEPAPLILTELAYPGWTVERDGRRLESDQAGQFRAVLCPREGGEFVWRYQPRSVLVGAVLSLLSLFSLATAGHLRFWHPRLTERILRCGRGEA